MDINLNAETELILESEQEVDLSLDEKKCQNGEGDLDISEADESAPEFDINLDKKRCENCKGVLEIIRFDENHVYYQCKHCGDPDPAVYTFQNQEEADFYLADAKWALFAELNEGLFDWTKTDWVKIRDHFIEFVNQHPYLENDLIFQMGILACSTHGFNLMHFDEYLETKDRFNRIDQIYKQRLKLLKAQMKNPVFSDSMESYKLSRAQYVELKNQCLQIQMAKKVAMAALKKVNPLK